MHTPHSVADDEDAPSPHAPLVVDVFDPTALDDVVNITGSVQEEEPKTLENPKQDQVGIKSSNCKMSYDEFHEMLSWMPAKAAIKYSSSLCKWLCNIHSEPRFIQKQCIRSCGQENGFFLKHTKKDNDRVLNEFEFHILPSVTGSTFGIPRESVKYIPKSGRILSSSNGLLLLGNQSRHNNYILRVCNPVTKECTRLRLPKDFKVQADESLTPLIECYPWGYGVLDEVHFPNDYTIALPIFEELCWREINGLQEKVYRQRVLVYSHGRWDEELCDVIIEGRVVRYDMPVGIFSIAAKGLILHYLCDTGKLGRDTHTLEPYIAAFNIQEKKLLREIMLPERAWEKKADKVSGKSLWIFKWNEKSICLVKWKLRSTKGMIKAWVLDDYGCEGESWRLVMDTSERELWPKSGGLGIEIISVGVAGGGKGLLLATAPAEASTSVDVRSRLFLYVVEGEDRGRLELVGNHHFSVERVPPVDPSFHPYASFGLMGYPAKDPGCLKFLPYANTLRPVSVQNSKTLTY